MASLYIKRRRDPYFVDDERATKVKNRWLGLHGVTRAESTELVDLGVWAGEYGQIGSIEIESEKRDDGWADTLGKEYSDEELAKFHQEMEKYKTTRKHWSEDRDITVYDTEQYLQDVGAVSYKDYLGHPVRHAVMSHDGKFTVMLYENKIAQWKNWRWRMKNGKEIALAQLAELQEGVKEIGKTV